MRYFLFCCFICCAGLYNGRISAASVHLRNALTDVALARTTSALGTSAPKQFSLLDMPRQGSALSDRPRLSDNQKLTRGRTLLIIGLSFLAAAAILIPGGIGMYENNRHDDGAVGGILMAGTGVVLAWTGIGLSIPGLIITRRYRK